jgi:hypothetical protein
MMTKLLASGYCVGVCSSRRIQKRLQEDIGFKVLAAGNEPDFRTISDFGKIQLEALRGLFEQVLEMALESGAMSYGRMNEKQPQLREEVKRLLAEAEAADEVEDRRYGNKRGEELPEELQRRETRLARIKQARKALEQRARDKAAAEGKPEQKDQYNFTDPESRIMKGGAGVGVDCGPGGDASGQRQRAVEADGGGDRAAVGTEAGGDSGRQRLLFGREPEVAGIGRGAGEEDRRLDCHRQAEAWRAPAAVQAEAAAEGGDAGGPDDAEDADQGGQGGVRGAQVRGRTGVRTDQAGAGNSAISAPGNPQNSRGVGAGVPDASHSEAVRGPAGALRRLAE